MISAATIALFARRRRVRHAWDVISVLVSRDLKVLYKRSSLGFGWALVSPLLQGLIFVLVFRRVLGGLVENYASFVFSGVLVWGWFHASLVQSTGLITSSRALVRQPGFPLELLPHVTVGVRLVHFALALPFLAALLSWQGIPAAWSWTSIPLLIVLQFALTVAIAYPLAALNVRRRDTQHVTAVLLQLTMYLTPVFYTLDVVPEALRGWFYLNPMVPLLGAWRDVLLHGLWPNPLHVSCLIVLAGVLLVAGRRLFIARSRCFVEEL
jgi:lipopolysaccharide transport system permease protein